MVPAGEWVGKPEVFSYKVPKLKLAWRTFATTTLNPTPPFLEQL